MINKFSGSNDWLSNFYVCNVEYDGVIYPSSEHAYQAAKTLDPNERQQIKVLKSPGQAKRAGMKVTLRPDWEAIKIDVMYSVLINKFTQNEFLRRLLLDTGDEELVEGNKHGDTFWGQVDGMGSNHLGKLLMKVRGKLKEEQ